MSSSGFGSFERKSLVELQKLKQWTKLRVSQGRSRGGAAAPPLSLIERFSKDDTTPLTTPKQGKNDVEMP